MRRTRGSFQLRWGDRPLQFRSGTTELTVLLALTLAGLVYLVQAPRRELPAGTYFPNCDAARAAGVAPIYAGEHGYREALDGDDDGIACEPIRR